MSGQDRKAGGSAEDEEVQAASAGLPRQLYGVGDTGRFAEDRLGAVVLQQVVSNDECGELFRDD